MTGSERERRDERQRFEGVLPVSSPGRCVTVTAFVEALDCARAAAGDLTYADRLDIVQAIERAGRGLHDERRRREINDLLSRGTRGSVAAREIIGG